MDQMTMEHLLVSHTFIKLIKKNVTWMEKMLSYNLPYNTCYLFNIADIKNILYQLAVRNEHIWTFLTVDISKGIFLKYFFKNLHWIVFLARSCLNLNNYWWWSISSLPRCQPNVSVLGAHSDYELRECKSCKDIELHLNRIIGCMHQAKLHDIL